MCTYKDKVLLLLCSIAFSKSGLPNLGVKFKAVGYEVYRGPRAGYFCSKAESNITDECIKCARK